MTYNMPGSISFADGFLLTFKFFILQAIGIQCEDVIIAVYENIGFPKFLSPEMRKPLRNWCGYLWVISWFWFTLGWGGDAYLKSGIMFVNDVPLPIAGKVLKNLGL